MKKHSNLSIFVPHAGCNHMCSFCDQRTISQTSKLPSPKEVTQMCEKYLPKCGENTEIAFFGGSFTAISEAIQYALLNAAFIFVNEGRAEGIRISTRPDAISKQNLAQLKLHGVTSIELGAQSMHDDILKKNMRGHTASDVVNAAKLIKENGFSLGLQMMPGLYGVDSYEEEALQTMQILLSLKPDTMRIYPAIVLENTKLASLYKAKLYNPLTIDEAVIIASKLLLMCEAEGVKVIRTGLAADTQLEKAVLAGPYHPAFKELCEAQLFYDIIYSRLLKYPKGRYSVLVAKGKRSAAGGQKNQNIALLKQCGYDIYISEAKELSAREIFIQS